MSVEHALLALLGGEPDSAGGLQARFLTLTGGAAPLDDARVAHTLSCLERNGLIEAAGSAVAGAGRDGPSYRRTAAGCEETDRWLRTGVVRPADASDELLMKISLAAAGDLTSLLDAHRHRALEQLREVTRLSQHLPDSPTARRLQAERRILDLEAEIRFLDRVEVLHREKKNP